MTGSMFSKPNALVYVLRGGLIVAGKHITQARLDFPPELVANMEIRDSGAFIEYCQRFFIDNGLRHKRVLVVFDNSVVFKKSIGLDQSGKPSALADAFVDAMPFQQGQRACLILQTNSDLQLFGINASLCQSVAEALRGSSVRKIVAMSPVAVYNIVGPNQKLSALIDRFFKDASSSKVANFLSVESL